MKYSDLVYATAFVCLLVTAACNRAYNPLEGFEEVKPETIRELPVSDPAPSTPQELEQVSHGRYLVELLGCANCHTDGALIGEPDPEKQLAGSNIGIAYTNPMDGKLPGVLFPSNLTPDMETGIGAWSDPDLIRMIRSGIDRHGQSKLSVMPWPAYSIIADDDALAIVSYLRSLKPVRHRVPENVKPGKKSTAPYVHFGMYRTQNTF